MALLELGPSCYRTRFFLGVAQTLLPPLLGTYALLKLVLDRPTSDFVAVLVYCMSPCVYITVSSWLHVWQIDRQAKALGARPIPRARGKWPGNIDIMLRFAKDLRQGYILQAMGEVLDEHGCDTLNTRILWKDNIITRDDLHMRSVHMTSFESFERGPEAAEKMGTFLGNGVFVTDGNRWKRERALIRPFLNKERVSDFEIFTKYAEKALAVLNDAAEAGATLDLQDLFSRFTLDSASEFLLGHAPDALSASRPVPFHSRIGSKGAATDDPFGSFLYSFEEVQVTISLRWRLNTFFPLYEMFGDKTKPHADVINKWMKPTVMKALQDKARDREHGIKQNSEERTLLDSLVESTDDEETVRYGILNVLMAGRDTTAGLLTFTVYLLTMYPDVLKRLKEEVLSVLGPSGNPTQEAIRNMPYMNAVLSETLRLYPGAPMGIRNSITEVLLPTADGSPPLYFPPRARVTWLTLLMHRRADLWGADCEEFDPARWLDSARMAAYNARPSIYVPFLSGPRMCPGQMFALSEASFMISRLMQKFSGFELVPEAIPEGAAPPPAWKNGKGRQRIEKVWPSTAFTAFIKGGLWVRPVH